MEHETVTPDTLGNVMEFDHIIRVHEDGTVSDSPDQPYMEVGTYKGDDGIWHDHTSLPDGWHLMTGYSGQQGYNGPHMHSSEYICGRMAQDILETPGDYVLMEVSASCDGTEYLCSEDECNCDPESWAVAYKHAE